ncbi:MAG: MBL fold metallo-hydrolase [Acidimicrobiia bacterium]|nr:MBL fold metallo-hydrolase [Acidimicrobiia bacterium]
MRIERLSFAVLLLFGACASGPPEIRLIDDAAEALGGKDRILALQTITIEGEGSAGALTQSLGADGKMSLSSVRGYRQAIDLAANRMSIQYSTERQFTFVLPEPGPVHQAIDGGVAYNVGADGTARPSGGAADRQIEMLRHPITAVRAALAEGATISPVRQDGSADVVDITTTSGNTITLAVDRTTKLPLSVSNMTFNGILGDVAVTTSFSDYEAVDGVMLPKVYRTTIDDEYDFLLREINAASHTLDADLSSLAAPESVTAAAAPAGGGGGGGGGTRPPVVVTQLAQGVHHLGGLEASGGFQYNSVLVEFADHAVLIEPIQGETRTLEVIAKARETTAKPVTKMVVTHAHSDHAGGARAAVAQGLALVVHESTVDFWNDIIRRPFASNPDYLAKNPVEPKPIEAAGDHLRWQDGTQTMDIYHFPTNVHADHMLFAHFPDHAIVVDADMYNMDPGPSRPAPDIWPASMKTGVIAGFNLVWADNFLAELERRNLAVKTLVPIHGVPMPIEKLREYRARWNEDGTMRLDAVQ